MKKILFIMFSVLIAGTMLQSCKKSDANLKNEVDKVLADQMENAVVATVKDGVVTLTGTVPEESNKTTVANAVLAVKGVKSVVNNLVVPAKPEIMIPQIPADDVIKTTVESGLSLAGFKEIKANVTDGEVTLTGDLKRADLTKVMQIVNEAKPRRVINNITLK